MIRWKPNSNIIQNHTQYLFVSQVKQTCSMFTVHIPPQWCASATHSTIVIILHQFSFVALSKSTALKNLIFQNERVAESAKIHHKHKFQIQKYFKRFNFIPMNYKCNKICCRFDDKMMGEGETLDYYDIQSTLLLTAVKIILWETWNGTQKKTMGTQT